MNQLRKVMILCVVLVSALPSGAAADYLYNGEYIGWRVEEYDGYSWRTLDAHRTDLDLKKHCELESLFTGYPTCNDGKKRVGPRYSQGVNPFVSSAFSIDPVMGRQYRVIIKNRTSCRMAVTLEVDGLNSINSREVQRSGDDSAWVLGGYEAVSVQGFQSGIQSAREFYWTTPDFAHSNRYDRMGTLLMHVYFEDDSCARDTVINECGRSSNRMGSAEMGTGAGGEINSPVRKVQFDELTNCPLETVKVVYSDNVSQAAAEQSCSCTKKRYNPPTPLPEPPAPEPPAPDNCYLGLGVLVADNSISGASVVDVYGNSPASRAGIVGGDRIVYVGGITVNNSGDLKRSLAGIPEGSSFEIQYVRNGSTYSTTATMGYVCP